MKRSRALRGRNLARDNQAEGTPNVPGPPLVTLVTGGFPFSVGLEHLGTLVMPEKIQRDCPAPFRTFLGGARTSLRVHSTHYKGNGDLLVETGYTFYLYDFKLARKHQIAPEDDRR